MIVRLYSVRDAVVGAFLPMFPARSDGEATRSFQDACQDAKHPFAAHLADFTLFCLAEFDDSTGSVIGFTSPVKIVDGLSFELRQVSPG